MKFVVISKQKHMTPPEMIIPLLDAFLAYIDKYTESGNFEDVWSFAGTQGGGATINVESLEELDAILTELPLGPFLEHEVYPAVDLREALRRGKKIAQARMEAMA